MTETSSDVLVGGCDCGHVRYELGSAPIFVHCCHCRWCQRESGSAFALNALIETDRVTILGGAIEIVHTPSESGKGQDIARCPDCKIAVWSHFSGAGDTVAFVRVGTLDDPDRLPPDIHIFTASKQPWVTVAEDVPVMEHYYDAREVWPENSLNRFKAVRERS